MADKVVPITPPNRADNTLDKWKENNKALLIETHRQRPHRSNHRSAIPCKLVHLKCYRITVELNKA